MIITSAAAGSSSRGGLGFIGSNLARRLVELDAEVLLVDSLVPELGGRLFNIDDIRHQVTVELVDARDEERMGQLVRGQHYLFNLAGQTSCDKEDPGGRLSG